MNIFNRALVVALLFISVVFWTSAIFVILFFPRELLYTAGSLVVYLEDNISVYTQLMFSFLGAIFAVVSLLLLIVELTPRAPLGVQLNRVTSGAALLTTEAIVQRVSYDAEQVPQVQKAKAIAESRGKAVDIRLDLYLAPESDISTKTEEVCRIVRETVEGKMGVKLSKLQVHIHHQPVAKAEEKTVPPIVATREGLSATTEKEVPIFLPAEAPEEKDRGEGV